MPEFSQKSESRLSTCDHRLRTLFVRVCEYYDCTILFGHRDETTQNRLFDEGKSKVQYPDSRHNSYPSRAVDVAPWPIPDWDDEKSFIRFAGFVDGMATAMGIKIRWGGDWDSDRDMNDQTFNDLIHFELVTDE